MANRKSKNEIIDTNKNVDKKYTTSISRKMWQMYLQVGFIGMLIVVTMWYAMSTGSRIAKQYSPLVYAVMEIKLEATTAHLWFEEIISGDQHEDINKVWNNLNKAEWYAKVMLDGGQNEEGLFIPLDDSKLRQEIQVVLEKIKAFRAIAKERFANLGKSAVGSDIDQRFDAVFNSFLVQADDVETALKEVMNKDTKRFQTVQTSLIVLCIILTGIIGFILHRFERRQLINLSILKASNQQLTASEQQLKASNQQLSASEQQLKASNQQLKASEQQLKASNQQLKASEQQLKAINQQLIAGEQQLISSEQQLKASNQQLRASEQQLKTSNQQLLESQQKLTLHVQHTPLAVIQWDLNFKVTEWNNAAEKIFGFTSEEAIGRHAAGLIVPESAKKIINQVWRDLIAQKGGTQSNNENITKDNKNIFCEWFNTPLIDDNGEAIGVASLVMDITERKQAEDALQKSENKLLEAQKIANLGHYVLDVKTGNWTSSDELNTIFGIDESYKRDVANWLNIIHPDYKETLSNYLQDDVLKQHQKFDMEYKIVDASTGTEKWVHGLGTLKFDENGNPIEMFGTIQDITKRKQAEELLLASEERFRTQMAQSPLVMEIYNLDGLQIEVNRTYEELWGFPASTTVNKFNVLKSKEVEDTGLIVYVKRAYAGEAVTVPVYKFDPSGETESGGLGRVRWLSTKIYPLKDSSGKVISIVISHEDITETKRLQELESRASRLETAGTIAGQVAHDFNNLLAPLMAYPDFIREELPHNNQAHAYLDDIENAAQKIAEINQDLLTMGRRGHYNQDIINLNRTVLYAIKEMESQSDTVTYETDLCKSLFNMKGGSAQIHRMLTNLLVNAKDAMQDIGQIYVKTENYYVDDISIAFGRVPKGEYIKLTISDTGCGIVDDIIQKIFDPFFTTKATDKKRGSGLGLSVVDAVVNDHNGYIDLSSSVGKGTSFYIYFPISRESIDSQDQDEICGGSETLLIVDDDDVQREVSTQLLKRLGYEVSSVASGESAIKFLKENPCDLVILDMVMPGGIDGTETYRQILEINPYQKAIILSGFSQTDRVLEVQKLGAGAFVRKPVTQKVVGGAVRTELDRKLKITPNS